MNIPWKKIFLMTIILEFIAKWITIEFIILRIAGFISWSWTWIFFPLEAFAIHFVLTYVVILGPRLACAFHEAWISSD